MMSSKNASEISQDLKPFQVLKLWLWSRGRLYLLMHGEYIFHQMDYGANSTCCCEKYKCNNSIKWTLTCKGRQIDSFAVKISSVALGSLNTILITKLVLTHKQEAPRERKPPPRPVWGFTLVILAALGKHMLMTWNGVMRVSVFSLLLAWTSCWINSQLSCDLRLTFVTHM